MARLFLHLHQGEREKSFSGFIMLSVVLMVGFTKTRTVLPIPGIVPVACIRFGCGLGQVELVIGFLNAFVRNE